MRKRGQKFWKPVAFGFAVLYLVSMGLATWMMELKFIDEFKDNAIQKLSSFQRVMESDMQEEAFHGKNADAMRKNYYNYIVSHFISVQPSSPFQQFSAAVYQKDGRLLAKTEDSASGGIETGGLHYNYHTLDGLTEWEKEQLAAYEWKYYNDLFNGLPKYRILMREKGGALGQILVQEITWKKESTEDSGNYEDPVTGNIYSYETENGDTYREAGSEIVWEWNVPGTDTKIWNMSRIEPWEVNLLFPYLRSGGIDQWKQWNRSEYLCGFGSQANISDDKIERILREFSDDAYRIREKDSLYVNIWADNGDDFEWACYAALRFESHPWLAAMDYLKYEYLAGLALTLACIVALIYAVNKTYRQRAAIEEMRRDFTNAMAHELKTPLGIIRGFAENLQEHHMEDKWDYYLEQIIGQTEEMDQLVAEMIAISKMDSEQMNLQKEPVSIGELVQEQAARLEPLIQEKNLQVQYTCAKNFRKDFTVEGDRGYLAKVIWNLLSNAAAYNIPGGSILVQTEAGRCIIENTGTPLTDEQMVHAFDMFYRGDKSRNSEGKHMGMGLYLAKKILELHGMKISLENTQSGVRAIIER